MINEMLQSLTVITHRIENKVCIQTGTMQIHMNDSMIGYPMHSTECQGFLQNSKHTVPSELHILNGCVGMGCQIDGCWDVDTVRKSVASEVVESFMIPQIKSSGGRFMSNVLSGALQYQSVG